MFQLVAESVTPPFTVEFSHAVSRLYDATEMTPGVQRERFSIFLRDYGTHYVTEMLFGAKVYHTQKYSALASQTVDRDTLKTCAEE